VGNVDTYTWKNHFNWYKNTQSKTVIWLMRKATKAFSMMVVFMKTTAYLRQVAKKALAVDWLLNRASHIMMTNKRREDAKMRLIMLSLKSRQVKSIRAECFRFLDNAGRIAKARAEEEEASQGLITGADGIVRRGWQNFIIHFTHKVFNTIIILLFFCIHYVVKKVQPQITVVVEMKSSEKKKADYGTLFRLNYRENVAYVYLVSKAVVSKAHYGRQLRDRDLLQSYASQVVSHFSKRDLTFEELRLCSERARDQCTKQDQAWVALIRLGGLALKYLLRQEAALQWLLDRSARGLKFDLHRLDTGFGIYSTGQKKLMVMNRREHGYCFLADRMKRARDLFVRQAQAFEYLSRLSPGAMKQSAKRLSSGRWLIQRAKLAVEHSLAQRQAHTKLKHLAIRRQKIMGKLRETFEILLFLLRVFIHFIF
jgi:hypothetical protein